MKTPLAVLTLAAANAVAGEFVIRDLSVGMPMAGCPLTFAMTREGTETSCYRSGGQVANVEAEYLYLSIIDGRLAGFQYVFPKGRLIVKNALIEKFGPPALREPDRQTWFRGNEIMIFTRNGTLIVFDKRRAK